MPALTPSLLLLLSGATAWTSQGLWIQQAAQASGGDPRAGITVLCAILAGWAAGALLWGCWSDKSRQPYRLFALSSAGGAALGLATTWCLHLGGTRLLATELGPSPEAWALPVILIGLPSLCFGASLPVLIRVVRPKSKELPRLAAGLLAPWLAGSAVGALATPFWWLPQLGIMGAAALAALLQVATAIWAVKCSQGKGGRVNVSRAAGSTSVEAWQARLLWGVAGGLAVGCGVVWSGVMAAFVDPPLAPFVLVLPTCLVGLAVGSTSYVLLEKRFGRPWSLWGLLVMGTGILLLAMFAAVVGWPFHGRGIWAGMVARGAADGIFSLALPALAVAAVLTLLPAAWMGAAFGPTIRLAAVANRAGRDVGWVAGCPLAGGVVGMLLTSLVFVPQFGLVQTLGMLAVMTVGVGGMALLLGAPRKARPALAIIGVVAGIFAGAWVLPRDALARLGWDRPGGRILYYEEDLGGSVTVTETRGKLGNIHHLYLSDELQASDDLPGRRRLRLQALLPLLIHKEQPRSVLTIGMPGGEVPQACLAYPSLDQCVCTVALPALARAAGLLQKSAGAPGDSRFDMRVAHGRRLLTAESNRYDLILTGPPPPSMFRMGNLHARPFYLLARDRLRYGGLMAQRWVLARHSLAESRSMVQTFLDVFPFATLWATEASEVLLVGSMTPITLDAARIQSRLGQPGVNELLREVGVGRLTELMATYLMDRAGLERFAGEAPLTTDLQPVAATSVQKGPVAALSLLEALGSLRSGIRLDAKLAEDATRERERLLHFHRLGLHADAGQWDHWEALAGSLSRQAAGNAYYQWLLAR